MEEGNTTSISFDPEQAKRELEEKQKASKLDVAIRERMSLAVGCEEMTRIVSELLIPEFLNVVHIMRESGYRSEVVAYDAVNPVYEDEMCDAGMKFRCGDRDSPCKIEFIADPNEFVFNISIRNPDGTEDTESWPFAKVIPRNIRKLIKDFLGEHFRNSDYDLNPNDYDQFDEKLEGPFKIKTEENGEVSEIASTETMEEAIKMGASFITMFKGKPLFIVDRHGETVC